MQPESGLFDAPVESTTAMPGAGCRLHRLEVYNWAPSPMRRSFEVDGRTPAHRRHRSGKSTLVDASPRCSACHRISYNKAAGADNP